MLSVPTPSIVDQRRDQIVPKLDSLQIERVRRFGEVRSFAAGERIMTAGEVAPGLVVVLRFQKTTDQVISGFRYTHVGF
jgi:thioredoxin reductase (NADPH)